MLKLYPIYLRVWSSSFLDTFRFIYFICRLPYLSNSIPSESKWFVLTHSQLLTVCDCRIIVKPVIVVPVNTRSPRVLSFHVLDWKGVGHVQPPSEMEVNCFKYKGQTECNCIVKYEDDTSSKNFRAWAKTIPLSVYILL